MSMSSGPPPYIGSHTENLTLSDPRCNSDACKAFYDGHQLSQKLTSYAHQYDYGHYVTWFYLASIGVFTAVYLLQRLNEYRYHYGNSSIDPLPSIRDRAVGLWRYCAYRRWPGWVSNRFGLPSMGILALMLLAILFCLLLTFWARPYYRNHRGYGSPPIAVRTGLMSTALTPLIFALSGKANLITLLTGIGHEKLNILHRWTSWICFGLAVAHTIPFIVAPLKDGGYKALHKQFYKPGAYEYTGTPALAILFGLLIFSLPWIRHRMYEGFYHLHFWLAVTYVGLMFWHCDNEGDSWVYMWATLAVWFITMLARAFYYTRPTSALASRWFEGSPMVLRAFPDNMTRIEILAPDGFHWKPGQHVYLRVPSVGFFDNHPFTIAAADPIETRQAKDNLSPRIMPLYIRSYAGFTRRLRHCIETLPEIEMEAWLEGPYGGHNRDLSVDFDNIILVAGGGGISAVLPWLESFVQKFKSNDRVRTSSIRLVWSVKEASAVSWIADALDSIKAVQVEQQLSIDVHVTQDNVRETKAESAGKEISLEVSTPPDTMIRPGRMDLQGLFEDVPRGSRTMVIGCGPESLKVDLSNAAARAQSKVISGRVSGNRLVDGDVWMVRS